MWSILLPLAFVLPHVAWVRSQQSINILFVYDEKNTIAKQAFDVSLKFLRESLKYGITFNDVQEVVVTNSSDARGLLDKICFHYNNSIKEQKLPDIVLDATMTGITSETVKSFTNALALPTVSTSYGQEGDLRQWRDIDAEKQKYLVQIMPPGDLMPQVIRSIVQTQNISNAAILFDDTFVMDHKYKSLLVNMPTRHVITMIDKDPKKQLSRLRDVDIVNFFVVGTQASIKNVLEAAAYRNFFDRKFAWYAITKDELQLECKDCKNATVGVLKPAITVEDYRTNLENLKSKFKLDMKPSIDAAFYFDVTVKALIAVKTMKERGEWPADMKYVTCDEYDDNNAPTRTNLDLKKALKEVNDPEPSYGSFVIDRNGHSFMEFTMPLWKVRFVNGQSSREKELAQWKAAVEGPIDIKDFEQMRNFSAVTVYRVITVHEDKMETETDLTESEESSGDSPRKFPICQRTESVINSLLGTVSNIRTELEALDNLQQQVFAAQKKRLEMVEAQLAKSQGDIGVKPGK